MEEVTNLFSQYVQDFINTDETICTHEGNTFKIINHNEWMSRLFGVAEGMCMMYNTLKKIPFTQQIIVEDMHEQIGTEYIYSITFKEN